MQTRMLTAPSNINAAQSGSHPNPLRQSAHLNITGLSLSIGHKRVLDNIDMSFKAGQVTALLGPNGAGKSSLLKALCQEVIPHAGEIQLNQRPLRVWQRAELAKSLAVLPQHASLTFPFSVTEVVAMGLYPLTINRVEGDKLIEQQLAAVELTHLANRSYPTLSGGEKQRVQLARVLTQLQQSPFAPILLLDEPTSALDLAQQHNVLQLVHNLAHEQGYTVVVVLHDLNQAARYADYLLVLKQGQLVAQGTAAQALSAQTIRHVWGYDARLVTSPDGGHPLIF